ncbi:hypothetical protein Syun_012566 [Stephania yunnanensis]|uniref:Bifunctional inhibitor/plant lipid transfer protein/seed storage helical domain-containing protein n=1 Tax=Stephania yunnanensis TaxID=152371 RepID=A0AAP0JZN6_9MAGN
MTLTMGSKLACLLILLNVIVFSCVSSHSVPCAPPKTPSSPKLSKPAAKCPKNTVKFGACADVLNGLVNLVVGTPPSGTPCCALLKGLTDLEAAVCLCTAIKANALGALKVDAHVALSLLVSTCAKKVPEGFKCA